MPATPAAEWPHLLSGGCLHPVRFALGALWCWTLLRAAAWVARDSAKHRVPHGIWRAAALLGGLVSLLPLASGSWWSVSVPLALALGAAPAAGYVAGGRNPALPPEKRLLTDAHLAKLRRRALRGLGIDWAERSDAVTVALPRNLRTLPDAGRRTAALEEFLAAALRARATDAALEIGRGEAVQRFRVDGVWTAAAPTDPEAAVRMHELVVAASAPGDARRLRRCVFEARRGAEAFAAPALATGSAARLRTSFQLPDGPPRGLDSLGLSDADVEAAAAALCRPAGLLLLCGPPFSGRRSTVRAFAAVAGERRRVVALEEPGRALMLPGAQSALLDNGRVDGADSFRVAAADADVVAVGRIPDAATARQLLDAARTKLVVAAFEAESPAVALAKLGQWAPREMVADRLLLALGQRLPRKLCAACREAYRPDPTAVRRAHLGSGAAERLYRTPRRALRFCPACQGLGYAGCAAAFETLAWRGRVREAFLAKASDRALALEACKEGMVPLADAAFGLLLAGTTSADELRRAWHGARAREDAA